MSDHFHGMTPSEVFRDVSTRMQGASGEVLVTIPLSAARHAAIMLDREYSPEAGDDAQGNRILEGTD